MPFYLAIVAAAAPAEPSMLMSFALKYETWKLAFSEWAMFSDRELHVSLGLLVFFLTMILFRRPMRSVWPWLAVILFEMSNEYLGKVLTGSWNWPDTKLDILFTLLWPTLFFAAARISLIPRE
jgi:predicted MPP superfamily phosphohydrolase